MLSLFRNFFQSKIGLPIFIGFLILMALAFAASDISGSSTFGGLGSDDKLAKIGSQPISSSEMQGAMNNALDRARAQNPTITMPELVADGVLERELEVLMDRFAIGQFARKYGLRAGDNLVNSEILKIQAFKNLTGEFDQETYQAALRRQGITDTILRKDIADGLLAQQLLRPALAAPQMSAALARQYSALVLERREGQIGLIPSLEYAPEAGPTNRQLTAFYRENRADYILPERRTIRFAVFGTENLTKEINPSAAAIAARYEKDKALYAAQERRAISSFVVPTEAGAKALVARIRAGASLEAVAAEAGFNVSTPGLIDREKLSSSTSFALAQAVFAAKQGEVINPQRSTLGWTIARIDEIERTPARTLAQVRDQIADQLRDEVRAGELIELSSQIEEKIDTGTSLGDVAKEFGLEITAVPDVTADGQIYGTLGQGLNQALQPILETAFQMEEGDPQITELVPGEQFLIFDVSEVTQSAPPPLAQVRDEVIDDWRRAEGSKAARAVADRVLAAVRRGKSLREAMQAENPRLTQIEQVALERRELLAAQRNLPAPLVLFFSMARGSTKILEDANNVGWFVVNLEKIEADRVEENPQVIADTRTGLAPALAAEYSAQLSRAIRAEIGAERNEEAIEALRKTLAGEN